MRQIALRQTVNRGKREEDVVNLLICCQEPNLVFELKKEAQ